MVFPIWVDAASGLLEHQRQLFLQAEKLVDAKNEEQFLVLANQLKDYPLYPYLQYQWLSSHLEQNKKIQQFLIKYRNSRYASLLKNKWLRYLAKRQDWEQLIKYYRNSSQADIQCAYYLAKYKAGQKKTALTAARKLWVVGKSQPKACEPLFKILQSSKYFTRELLWQRFQAALKRRRVSLARYVQRLMGKKDRKVASLWLKAHQNPKKVILKPNWHKGYKQAGLIFAHAIDQIARRNSKQASEIWDQQKHQYIIPQYRVDQIERRLALGLAFRGDETAWQRLNRLKKKDIKVKEWMIRTALREMNWPHVEQALASLTPAEKKKINWQYWQARVYEQTGRQKQAEKIYQQLSKDRSFYGFLAAHHLKQDIALGDKPLKISEVEINTLKQRPEFQLIAELNVLDRVVEAKRQWWYQIKRLKKTEIMAAAKLAEQWDWNQVAIYTIARAKYWDDVGLRFPIKYENQIQQNARLNNLDPAIILGLIRRESAFDEKARSRVGARGLMQIMPKTGRQIARDLKQRWHSESVLFNPEVNVKYGSYYYKQLLNQFNGHYALAAAAYNAGPHRVNKWLPELPMAADIWIETIPFKETRAYVGAVLTYAMIYQQRMHRNVLKIKEFLRDILPKEKLS